MKRITGAESVPYWGNKYIDVRTPNMSISVKTFELGVEKARKRAKEEHKILITNEGYEDYTK